MMTLNDYMRIQYPYEIIHDTEEGGYLIRYPDLPGCLSCAETVEEAKRMGEDARRAWISVSLEYHDPIPLPHSLENYSGQFKVRIPKLLHKELVYQASKQGVSLNQYCLYLLSKNSAIKA